MNDDNDPALPWWWMHAKVKLPSTAVIKA